jgi:hypothetical protein
VRQVVDRSFVVRAPLVVAWDHLADLERWPSWARHIRSVVKSPPGPLTPNTRGTIKLANGMTTTFSMTEYVPFEHWQWVGSLLGSHVLYDHIFSQDKAGYTTVRFTVAVSGGLGVLIAGIFGRIYRRNLERAVPLLIEEIERAARAES